ncbi:putative periplasmic binding protein [Campylobacter iguaniorum]|uniref:Putative periplasmic binding protein n=1 Tax=Campylobacter iguaniorum TaxID=1244531 RepID=A0A076F8H8_9BACT|nr:ABC transporter substrate-binding protein [Campylobacter iguaniorum]AII13998.1 putative periplasmic binding protein [Campylobacter iguaniorum]
MLRLIFVVILFCCSMALGIDNDLFINEINYRNDVSKDNTAKRLHPTSHIKIFLPSIAYSYIAKSTNSGLIRSYDNAEDFVYDLAKSHKRVDKFTYIFELRKGLKFQNGDSFGVDDVIYNLNYFKKHPFLYTNIDKIDFDVTKLDDLHFKITLKEPYEMFFTDLARIYFYTKEYIERYKPVGKSTGTSNVVPGPFGMGPYIIKDGYALGDSHTNKVELVANPHYWNKEYPKIKHITVYTQLNSDEALEDITKFEGKLDLAPIAFNKKLDVIMSDYAKLVVSESTDNITIFFNLINGSKKLLDQRVRLALNQALNQENLLKFAYKNEGKISPFCASSNYKIVKDIIATNVVPDCHLSEVEIRSLLNGLKINILSQDRFMFLLKGLEYQLNQYGVKFEYKITTSEKDIYKQLLSTMSGKNTESWDMLVWGNDDWYYKDPWTVFLIYKPKSSWSVIPEDSIIKQYIDDYFITSKDDPKYKDIVKNILFRAKGQAYTLIVPSPNKVMAVNKEVLFKPYQGGIIPLWEIEITKDHWSVRDYKTYPDDFKKPIKPKRYFYDESN